MKKTLLLVFGLLSLFGYSQKTGNNEIKINLPSTILGVPEVTYERIIDDTASAGLSLTVSALNYDEWPIQYMITPYYRLFFGKEKAKGFFIEANATVAGQKANVSYYDQMYDQMIPQTASITNLGFGAAIGGKWLNKNGYVGELYYGMGRLFNVSNTYDYTEIYPRAGFSIGKRF